MNTPTTALETLEAIRNFIDLDDYEEVTKFWNIITALRGPDYVQTGDRGKMKAATTEIIRHRAIGDDRCSFIGAFSGKDTLAKAKRRVQYGNVDDHFWIHAKLAFKALGLKWNKRNQ